MKTTESLIPAHYLEKLLAQRTRNLHKTNEQFAFLLESMNIIPYESCANQRSCLSYIHKSLKQVTGFDPGKFTSDHDLWFSRVHPEDMAMISGKLKNWKAGQLLSFEYRWQIADGSYKNFFDCFRQINRKNGKPLYILGFLEDVTERGGRDEQVNKF
ncbi:MAG: PAS domain-containing protein [Bacteroidota bacterium]